MPPEPEEPRRPDGPTEMVETDSGELVERLSGGTATLLLTWLIGVGALSTLVAAWLFALVVYDTRLGPEALFGGFGFYVGLAGAAGPCVLWLAGRAQGHPLRWFVRTALKIALLMGGMLLAMLVGAAILVGGMVPGTATLALAAVILALVVPLSVVWALATWAADRWIARARTEGGEADDGG
jgi:hypothetical protein